MHLASYGIEDIFLTGEPQITYFKIVYRRHTNFSVEEIRQNFIQLTDFGTKVTAPLSRNGDLAKEITLIATLPRITEFTDGISKAAWVRNIGYRLIKSISIEINGRTISKHYGEWMFLFNELFNPQNDKINKMTGNIPELYNFTSSKESYKLYVPLQFWFNRNSGSALPLVSLLYSDIKINFEVNTLDYCLRITPTHYLKCDADIVNFKEGEYITQTIDGINYTGIFLSYDILNRYMYYYLISKDNFNSVPYGTSTYNKDKYLITGQDTKFTVYPYTQQEVVNIYSNSTFKLITPQSYQENNLTNLHLGDTYLLVNYVYLDDEERIKFAQAKQDYIIEQVHFTENNEITGPNVSIQLNVDNPCFMAVWVLQQEYLYNAKEYDNYTNNYDYNSRNKKNLITEETILLNDKERLSLRNSNYFDLVQKHQYKLNGTNTGINMFSFSLNPFNTQPSGSCNMSKMEKVYLKIKTDPILSTFNFGICRMYQCCYNILRIANGFGGVIFEK